MEKLWLIAIQSWPCSCMITSFATLRCDSACWMRRNSMERNPPWIPSTNSKLSTKFAKLWLMLSGACTIASTPCWTALCVQARYQSQHSLAKRRLWGKGLLIECKACLNFILTLKLVLVAWFSFAMRFASRMPKASSHMDLQDGCQAQAFCTHWRSWHDQRRGLGGSEEGHLI